MSNIGGPYTILETQAELDAAVAKHRAQNRYICESIIAENEDLEAVEGAKAELAKLDALETRKGTVIRTLGRRRGKT